jgi:hypothetical protein
MSFERGVGWCGKYQGLQEASLIRLGERAVLQTEVRCNSGDLPTMSAPWILRRLYSLDTSSLDFSRHLYSLIRHDEKEQYLSSLQGPELTRLVDLLDEVRALPSTFCPVTKHSTGPQCHPHNRRCCARMSKQTASNLWSSRDSTILVHRIW